MKKRLLTMLVLLVAVVSGAWATTPNSIVINGTPQVGDKSISLTYHFDPNNVPGITSFAPTLKVKCAADNKWDETNLSLHEVSSGTTSISLSNLGEFEAGKTYEVCFAYYNGNWVDEGFQSFVPAAPATYTITLAEGTEDADKWTVKAGEGESQALPLEGVAEGASVTVTYNGTKKVKSVKAVKKEPIITWDNTNVFVKANQGKNVDKWNTSATFEGITISFNGEGTASHFYPYDTMGADLDVLDYGDSFTFTAPTGKKFAKIEINGSFSNLNDANWSTQANGIVWSNTPSNTVTIATTESYTTDFEYITSIVFTLSE